MSNVIINAIRAMSKNDLADLAMLVPKKTIMDSDFFKNRGRFFIDRAINLSDSQAKNELAFSNVIKRRHEQNDYSGLFCGDAELYGAFTMFQWLTTNVGQSALEEALRATGRKIVKIEDGSND